MTEVPILTAFQIVMIIIAAGLVFALAFYCRRDDGG